MKSVFKYRLNKSVTNLQMPEGSTVLHIHPQDEVPHLWALVDPRALPVIRKFVSVGTGQQIPELAEKNYIGSCHILNGAIVIHVFEVKA